MKKENYIDMMQNIKTHPKSVKFICVCNGLFTRVVYAVFLLFVLWLFLNKDERIIRVLLTTAISFIFVSVFRKIFNRKRPYETFGVAPVIPKNKKGNSFPSRHVFSAFVIAMACLYVNISLGILVMIVAIAIAVLRVLGGVHYPSDVIAGGVIGILSGIIGCWVL